MSDPYHGLKAYYGDLHSHCGISYGAGTAEEAFRNARLRLDFCSITGHAHWPDMPAPNERTQPIIDFHLKGFQRLKAGWDGFVALTDRFNEDGRFITFPGFEVHSMAEGDHTIVYRDRSGGLIDAGSLSDLKSRLRRLRQEQGIQAIVFPHHLGYRRGARGVNWEAFTEEFSPVAEIVSMHGCSETDESSRPFLANMGPSEGRSTLRFGLAQGHRFGVIGSTDHHSAHPGSYGHGLAGVWARALTRPGLWEALGARRTFALTGDRIELGFALNGQPMGAAIPPARKRSAEIRVLGGAAIDSVDLIKNNRIACRFSPPRAETPGEQTQLLHTKVFLELGWGYPAVEAEWEVDFGLSDGRILSVEPRFRGYEILSPLSRDEHRMPSRFCHSSWERRGERSVHFCTLTAGNPNHFTDTCQGMCLEVEMPRGGAVELELHNRLRSREASRRVGGGEFRNRVTVPLDHLLQASACGYLPEEIEAPAWKLHRAPLPQEFRWDLRYSDGPEQECDVYYVRVRQENDQWAWSSPIWVGERTEAAG